MSRVKAAVLCRVSDPGQHADNQLSDLAARAERRSLEVVATYEFQESAGKAPIKNNSLRFTRMRGQANSRSC